MDVMPTDELNKGSGYKLFGKDIMEIPCLRKSFLIGIPSGVATMLTYFLFTSKSIPACHCGFGTFMTVTSIYWTYCRYDFYKVKVNLDVAKEAINTRTINEHAYADSLEAISQS